MTSNARTFKAMAQRFAATGTETFNNLPSKIQKIEDAINLLPYSGPNMARDAWSKDEKILKGGPNDEVKVLFDTTSEQCALFIDTIREIELNIRMKVPIIADGNNFGVSVQHEILKNLNENRKAVQAHFDGLHEYFWKRGETADKIMRTSSKESSKSSADESSSQKKTDDKPEATTTSSKSKGNTSETFAEMSNNPHFPAYLVCHDVKYFFLMRGILKDLVVMYADAYQVVSLNQGKIDKPRGSRSGNSMY